MDNSIKLAGIAVVGAGIGFVVGFKLAEKQLTARFEERLENETKDMREFYETVRKPYATPQDAVKELIVPEVAKDPRVKNGQTQYHKVVQRHEEEREVEPVKPMPEQPVVQNVFQSEEPFVITQDSFMQNDPEHEQATLTYYEKSDTLCGEADEPIENALIVAGTAYKSRFGEDSSDPNVVHVRNPGLNMDFEIVRSMGSYEEEVLGQVSDTTVPPHKRVQIDGR